MVKLRDLGVRLKDICIREPLLIYKYYRPFRFNNKKTLNHRNVLMVDNRVHHGGMFDCMKGIITIYAISKAQHKDFKIHFVSPFRLEDYLCPNQYDWRLGINSLRYHFPLARPVFAYGEFAHPRRLWKNRKGETHFYYGYNSLDQVNAHFGTHYDWNQLYKELFLPQPHLQELIDSYKREIGNNYIVTHFRFLNLLGDKMEYASMNPTLPKGEQEQLMRKCKDAILDLMNKHPGKRVMLATDSNRFVEYAKQCISDIYTIPGKIKHVGTARTASDAEVTKMFLDYYLIGGAEKVYSLWAPGMWKSAFPQYAAMIGGRPFERIQL